MKYFYLILLTALSSSCNSQGNQEITNEATRQTGEIIPLQIGQYVVKVFEDSKRNLWFGTIEKGVAKYDGQRLRYFTTSDGLPGDRVVGIEEDDNGNLWFGTGSGLSKYDGNSFTNFTEKDGLCHNSISKLLIDSKGVFWIGTWNGVCRFDGKDFRDFPLPYPTVVTQINEDTKNWITEIKEDAEENIWFARDGYGAYKYDGKSFTHFLKKDGLHSNNVTDIEMDKNNNIWFGTRVAEKDNPDPEKRTGKGGVNKLEDDTIISFPKIAGFNTSDVYEIYRDRTDNLWFSTIKNGVYKFDGKAFKNYEVPIAIMSMKEDSNGMLWLGGAGGLYRIDPEGNIVNVTQKGPWK